MHSEDALSRAASSKSWPIGSHVETLGSNRILSYIQHNEPYLQGNEVVPPTPLMEEYQDVPTLRKHLDFAIFLVTIGRRHRAIEHVDAARDVLDEHKWDRDQGGKMFSYGFLAEAQIAIQQFELVEDSVEEAIAALEAYVEAHPNTADAEAQRGWLECLRGHALGLKGEKEAGIECMEGGILKVRSYVEEGYEDYESCLIWALEVVAELLISSNMLQRAQEVLAELRRVRERDIYRVAAPLKVALAITDLKLARVSELLGHQVDAKRHRELATEAAVGLRDAEALAFEEEILRALICSV